ncbi:hypothetical protein EV356DRAFT_515128 [Viridothelium virens]|uniref:DUF3752 domain-containing protein n=1 Tax=Viridothelium virens TaxID=1048519 RepID=A0A6A6H8Y4_VIRVR|nr:hypothetical protein EV356DRAFT_515128 [Viridothelium virens]
MPEIGPELPPHLLAKRKRQATEVETVKDVPPSQSPHHLFSSESGEKRRRVAGPAAAPPASLDEEPTKSADAPLSGEDSDSDDDYGPTAPSEVQTEIITSEVPQQEDGNTSADQSRIQRDNWMMIPPKEDGLAARMDPTRARPRKFNTGKGATASSNGGTIDASWTETPEEKRKRLADQVMGVEHHSASSASASSNKRDEEDKDTARRIREHNEKSRGKSLYDEHRRKVGTDKEDDPSKRAFDREKDIAGGTKIGHAQRKEMLNRAAGFGSRFSGGGFL